MSPMGVDNCILARRLTLHGTKLQLLVMALLTGGINQANKVSSNLILHLLPSQTIYTSRSSTKCYIVYPQ